MKLWNEENLTSEMNLYSVDRLNWPLLECVHCERVSNLFNSSLLISKCKILKHELLI